MVFKNTTFDHDQPTFIDALNVPTEIRNRCRERVIFASAANYAQSTELYEDQDDVPIELDSKTGDFSRVLSLITDQLEYEYTLVIFDALQNVVNEGIQKHRAIHEPGMSESNKLKLHMMIKMEEMAFASEIHRRIEESKDNIDKKISDQQLMEAGCVTSSSIFKRIDLVKQSHYNWDTYWNMIKRANFFQVSKTKGEFDVDDMLSNLFGS